MKIIPWQFFDKKNHRNIIFSLTEKNYVSFAHDEQRPFPFSGLLGTGMLEHFDIVLDLKNFYLYLKPIDK
jgi:hypothetical protein